MIDASILTDLMTQQFDMLYWISYNILHSQQDAQDAVQQGFLNAWAHRHKAWPGKAQAWLTRIVINESHNIYRYRKRVAPQEGIERFGAFAAPDVDVATAIAALPEKLRIPFMLKYLTGYSEREIADVYKVPVSTVKNRLFRARKMLRETLSDTEVTFS